MLRAEDIDESVKAEAAEWVVILDSGKISEAELERFAAWRRQSPAHAAAFELAEHTWRDFEALRGHAAAHTPEQAAQPFTYSAGEESISNRARRPRPSQRARWAAVAAGLVISLVLIKHAVEPLSLLRADYRTAAGETLSIKLPDGSSAQLNTDSALKLRYSADQRQIEVLKGEIAFTVNKDVQTNRQRPFVVAAAEGAARALGTRYVVHRQHESVQVTVVTHEVEVSLSEHSRNDAVRVGAGHALRYSKTNGLGMVRPVDLNTVTAWQRGRLIFDQVALAKVIDELNRYRQGLIVIADQELAQRQVSGVFRIDDLDDALTAIITELDLDALSFTPLLTILH